MSGAKMVARLLPVALVLAATPACAPKPTDAAGQKAEAAPVPVTVVPVTPVAMKRTVPVVGTLDAYKEVTLAPKVDGRVARVLRDTGDVVMPGDVLMQLDANEYVLDVDVARAGLDAELARLGVTELPTAAFDLGVVKSVARARASVNLSNKEFARAKDERARGVGTPQTYDKAEAEVELAETGLRVAEADARATLANARKMKSSLDKAEDRLRDAVVRAPVPDEWGAWAAAVGPAACPLRYVVAQRLVWEGEIVRSMPEKNVYRLVIAHVLKLRVTVPEKHAGEVRIGQPVVVRTDAFRDRAFPGLVSRVGPTVDTQNRTFQAEIEVPNGDPRAGLKPGTFARAEIETRTDPGVITVPPGAVVTFAGVSKVFLAEGDKARAVEVQLGRRDKDWVEVIGPVPAGARVITSGFAQLVDGSGIRVR